MRSKPFEVIGSSKLPEIPLPFSPAVRVGEMVFVSGQFSYGADGQIVEDTFDGEMRRALDNLKAVLAEGGLGLDDVVQVRNYLGSQDDIPEFNQIYREYFSEPYPARTTILGVLGTVLKYEVDVIAWAGKRQG